MDKESTELHGGPVDSDVVRGCRQSAWDSEIKPMMQN